MDCQPLFYKLPPENIVILKNILETYDGMTGELRTLNPARGEVVILALPDTVMLVRELISSIEAEIGIREIPQPEGVTRDGLLT